MTGILIPQGWHIPTESGAPNLWRLAHQPPAVGLAALHVPGAVIGVGARRAVLIGTLQ